MSKYLKQISVFDVHKLVKKAGIERMNREAYEDVRYMILKKIDEQIEQVRKRHAGIRYKKYITVNEIPSILTHKTQISQRQHRFRKQP